MANPRVKATYSLDVDTVRALERTARRWNVTRSAALRRAIHAAAAGAEQAVGSDALDALAALQSSLELTSNAAKAWATRSRRERRAASDRHEK